MKFVPSENQLLWQTVFVLRCCQVNLYEFHTDGKENFALKEAMKFRKESRGIALLFL